MMVKRSSHSASEVEKVFFEKDVLRIPLGKGDKNSIMKLIEAHEPSPLPFEIELYAVSVEEELTMFLSLEKGTPLKLIRMQEDSIDRNTIGVFLPQYETEDFQLGCIPRIVASLLIPIMDEGRDISCEVVDFVRGGPRHIGIRIRLSKQARKPLLICKEEI